MNQNYSTIQRNFQGLKILRYYNIRAKFTSILYDLRHQICSSHCLLVPEVLASELESDRRIDKRFGNICFFGKYHMLNQETIATGRGVNLHFLYSLSSVADRGL